MNAFFVTSYTVYFVRKLMRRTIYIYICKKKVLQTALSGLFALSLRDAWMAVGWCFLYVFVHLFSAPHCHPAHPVHIICPCTWEVIDISDVTRTTRNADGMGWSQPELGEKKTLASQRRGKQAGMDVRKPSSVTKINLSSPFLSRLLSIILRCLLKAITGMHM